ncbi:hypothetical protein ABZ654_39140 [Streptomyces hygroscopicus]|uniref:hypothetical protein n=1 Tax=Streptomyces hygroscopicus TaxID=1912 RepID=UPI0034001120
MSYGEGVEDGWVDEGLSRRMKALACTAPLHDLEVRKANQPWMEGERYQTAEVALFIIDQVAIAMDFESGARHEHVLERAQRFVGRQAPDRPGGEHGRVAAWVLENLINVRESDRVFRWKYGSINSSGAYEFKDFGFRILEERTDAQGDLYLLASHEALNVLVGALDTDVESAQIAAEVRLRNLIDRGRLADARHVAEQARVRTIQYGETIRRHLDATERNVRTVDWMQEVPDVLNEALTHVESRIHEEQAIERSILNNRDSAQDFRTKRRAAELVHIVGDCIRRHTVLQHRLLGARALFRTQQDRQQFSGTPRRASLDLHSDLLHPSLALTVGEAAAPLRVFVEGAVGPERQDQVNLATLVPALLAPPPAYSRFAEEEDIPGLLAPEDEVRFSEEQQRLARELLDMRDSVRTLSDVLAEAALLDDDLPELIVLAALRAFSPQLGSALRNGQDRLLIAVSASAIFEEHGFIGDDLLLSTARLDRPATVRRVEDAEEGSLNR